MKCLYYSLITLFFACSSFAQVQLSTPLEILTFMEASPTTYELEQLFGKIPRKNSLVIPHGTFIQIKGKKEYQQEYNQLNSKPANKWQNKARELISYEKPNYKKARCFYRKILRKYPQNAQVHTFMGETYFEEKQYDEAYQWFEKAVELNPIDYLARWLMAEVHLKNNELDSAMKYITIAHIYNRNHIRLSKRLHEIYQEKGQSYFRDWEFEPKYKVYKEDSTVVVTADGIWLTYGMYKAVWEHEPDYLRMKKNQQVTDYLFQEEMEATIGTFMTYSTLAADDKRNYPAMNAFALCLDHEMVEEFVMYEILLPTKPMIGFHITDEFMQRLVQYIAKVRGVKHTK